MRRLIFYIALWFAGAASAEAQVSFTAQLNSKQVEVGESFQLGFTLKNASMGGKSLTMPNLSDFKVVGGPNRMVSSNIVNGVATTSESVYYVLQAAREGTFSIGAASVLVNGKKYTTTPLSITVVKGKKITQDDVKMDAKEGVFVRAEVNTHEAKVGQQIILDYKLYTRVNLNGVNIESEPGFDGFFKQTVNDFPHEDNRVTIGGKVYLTRIVQRMALFPQREGELVIEPMRYRVGVVKGNTADDDDPFGQFFSIPSVESRAVTANSVNIYVQPLSAPPATFNGAVGDFQANFSLSKTQATTDDALNMTIEVVGNGDPKRWLAPKLPAPTGFEMYEPKTVSEESFEQQGEWVTKKTFEYILIPKQVGTFAVKPELVYYDVATRSYKTLSPQEPYNVTIAQGNNKAATILKDKERDIMGIKTATYFTTQYNSFYGTALFWSLMALPLAFFGLVIGYKQWQIQQEKRDINVIKRENAPKVAERRLAVAHDFLEKGNRKLFYEETSKALFNYVSDKFGMPLAEFTKSNVQGKLRDLGVKVDHVSAFVNILNDCEMALFAGRDTEGMAERVYESALKVVTEIEEDLR